MNDFLPINRFRNNKPKVIDDDDKYRAPVEFVCEFLVAIKEGKYKIALELSEKILSYEPTNKLVQEYQETLSKLVLQEEREALIREDDDDVEDDEDDDSDDDSNNDSDNQDSDEEIDYAIDENDDYNFIHK